MPLKATDTLLYPNPRLDPADLLGRLDRPDDKDRVFLTKLAVWAAIAGVDDAVLAAMWLVETDNGRSVRWNDDLNPGGIGIPADSTVQPFTIADADEAARIFVQCVFSLVRRAAHPDVPIPANAKEWFSKIWLVKVASKRMPAVTKVSDLNLHYTSADGDAQATWAWNPDHINVLISRATTYLPGVPDQGFSLPHEGGQPVTTLTFGKVPHPVYVDRPIRKRDGQGVGYYGQRHVYGVVLHRMIGTLWGTDEYFKTAAALTDYGVGVLAQDGAANDGVLLRWNDPLGDQSGWASGSYSSHAYGDGAAFVAKYATGSVGINAINRDQVSVEISGTSYTTPFSEKAKDSVAAIMAYWADQYHIPWDVFPIAPQDGFSFIRWHDEFGPENGQKPCPGDVVKAATADLIERARAIMKEYQTTEVIISPPEPPVYQEPGAWPWLKAGADGFGEDHIIGGTEVIYAPADFTTQKATPRYATGSRKGPKSGPDITKGARFHSDYAFRSATDNLTYRLTVNGNRVLASALLPRDGVSKNGTLSRRTTKGGKPTVIRKAKKKKAAA